MQTLTICQPYATLIATGSKTVENRKWSTAIRERIAIHAGKSEAWLNAYRGLLPPNMSFGAIVATAELIDCVSYDDVRIGKHGSRYDWILTDHHSSGPYCFILAHVRKLPEPIAARGNQGFWQFPDSRLPVSVR